MSADLLYVAAARDDVVEIASLLGGPGGRPVGHVLLASKPWVCLVVPVGAGSGIAPAVARLTGQPLHLIEGTDDDCRVTRFDREGNSLAAVDGRSPVRVEAISGGLTGASPQRLEEAFAAPAGPARLRAVTAALHLDDPTDLLDEPPAGFLLLDADLREVRERFHSAAHGVVLVPVEGRTLVVSDGTGPAPGPFALVPYVLGPDPALRGLLVVTDPQRAAVLPTPDTGRAGRSVAYPTATGRTGGAEHPSAATVLEGAGLPLLPPVRSSADLATWATERPGAEALPARPGALPVVDLEAAGRAFRARRRLRRLQYLFVFIAVVGFVVAVYSWDHVLWAVLGIGAGVLGVGAVGATLVGRRRRALGAPRPPVLPMAPSD